MISPMTSGEKSWWQNLLDDQHGIVTARQAATNGLSEKEARHRIASGQWLRVFRGVYSVTNGPLSRPMMLSSALLYAGPRILGRR